jgi:hypothetical protein
MDSTKLDPTDPDNSVRQQVDLTSIWNAPAKQTAVALSVDPGCHAESIHKQMAAAYDPLRPRTSLQRLFILSKALSEPKLLKRAVLPRFARSVLAFSWGQR